MTNPQARLPYPGLRAFNTDEGDLFFGRDDAVAELIQRLHKTRFLAVLGASGSGKSSLVRTGLFEGLELGLHPAGSEWCFCDFAPGGQPIRSLARALKTIHSGEETTEATLDEQLDALEWNLRRGPRSLVEWIEDGHIPESAQLLVLVDQFEELFRFSQYEERETAEAFVKLLTEAADWSEGRIHVVLTMRSEFLGACALIPNLTEWINAGSYLTPRMTREECRQAIVGPARLVGTEIEPKLVNTILNDLSSFAPWGAEDLSDQLRALSRRADQLPVMQHLLNRLWQLAADDDPVVLTSEAYVALGGLKGAIDAHSDEIIAGLSDAEKAIVPKIFRSLVRGVSLEAATRRPLRVADLANEIDADPMVLAPVIDAFRATGANYLRPDISQPFSPDMIVDISHESLIRQWTDLSAWVGEEAAAAASLRRLANAEARYSANEGGLLAGLDLDTMSNWWHETDPKPAWAKRYVKSLEPLESFLTQSEIAERTEQEQIEKRRRRNTRALATLAGTASVIAIIALVAVFYARQAATYAQEKEQEVAQERGKLLTSTEKLALGFVERLETNAAIPASEKLGLIQDTEQALLSIEEVSGPSPELTHQRAEFYLAGLNALRDAGMWAYESNLAGRLETLLTDARDSWTPEPDLERAAALALAEHASADLDLIRMETWLERADELSREQDFSAVERLEIHVRSETLRAATLFDVGDFATQWDRVEPVLKSFRSEWQDALGAPETLAEAEGRSIAAIRYAIANAALDGAIALRNLDFEERYDISPDPFIEMADNVALELLNSDEMDFRRLTLLRAKIDSTKASIFYERTPHMGVPRTLNDAISRLETLAREDQSNGETRHRLLTALVMRANYAAAADQFGQTEADVIASEALLDDLQTRGLPQNRLIWDTTWLRAAQWILERRAPLPRVYIARDSMSETIKQLRQTGTLPAEALFESEMLLAMMDLDNAAQQGSLDHDLVSSALFVLDNFQVDAMDDPNAYYSLHQRANIYGALLHLGEKRLTPELFWELHDEAIAEAKAQQELAPRLSEPVARQAFVHQAAANTHHIMGRTSEAKTALGLALTTFRDALELDPGQPGHLTSALISADLYLRAARSLDQELQALREIDIYLPETLGSLDSLPLVLALIERFEKLQHLVRGSDDDARPEDQPIDILIARVALDKKIDARLALARDIANQLARDRRASLSAEARREAPIVLGELRNLDREDAFSGREGLGWGRAPLLHASWRTLDGEDFEASFGLIAEVLDADEENSLVYLRETALSFYDEGALVEAQFGFGPRAPVRSFVILNSEKAIELDGSIEAIHRANALGPIKMDQAHSVGAYLRFYTHYFNGRQGEGSFAIFEAAEALPWQTDRSGNDLAQAHAVMRPLVLWATPETPGLWKATATILHNQALYHAQFEIFQDGLVKIAEGIPMAENLNTHILRVSDRRAGTLPGEAPKPVAIDLEALQIAPPTSTASSTR
ncbi:MAG: hypothetical protein AAGF94_02600 [Pseudomonadota bacterium]